MSTFLDVLQSGRAILMDGAMGTELELIRVEVDGLPLLSRIQGNLTITDSVTGLS